MYNVPRSAASFFTSPRDHGQEATLEEFRQVMVDLVLWVDLWLVREYLELGPELELPLGQQAVLEGLVRGQEFPS